MGIFWRSAMPLLSTLAALVIIVHSAEEDLDREYRYDVRPRALNTEAASYEQPWRVMKAEPTMKHTTENVWSQDSHEEQPKRRRKRKRRPIETSDEDLITQERFAYPESLPTNNHEVEYENEHQTTEIPRRRRKRINARTNRWADETMEAERPIRRRGNRRKRPSLETWPKLSEFPEHRREEVDPKPIRSEQARSEDIDKKQVNTYIKSGYPHDEADPVRYNGQMPLESQPDATSYKSDEKPDIIQQRDDNDEHPLQENKSLSEFSMEVIHTNTNENLNGNERATDGDITDIDKRQNEGYVSVLALKDLLKKSNGSSLSEILQQNNLTLTDLLRGKENAITILKSENAAVRRKDVDTETVTAVKEETKELTGIEGPESKIFLAANNQNVAFENATSIDMPQEIRDEEKKQEEPITTEPPKEVVDIENTNKTKSLGYMNRRRIPGMRKKLRLRPMVNSTYKSPLSRDLAALGLKRFPNRRNLTKSQEWKSMIPLIVTTQSNNEPHSTEKEAELITTTTTVSTTMSETLDDTTIILDFDKPVQVIPNVEEQLFEVNDSYIEIPSIELTEASVTTTESPTTTVHLNATEKPIVRQLNSSNTRRTIYNNRLKKKRLKNKNSTIEAPQNDVIKSLFGMGNEMPSSEFIAKTTVKKQMSKADEKEVDALEDFMTTAMSRNAESSTRSTKPTVTAGPISTTKVMASWRPTEETAEFEIEELLNDTRTSARLSKILMERNMTLNELVEHRERGSSHVHLADIFHNASREPNPPEPFLSKSLIEPISKETYPLRALLDAKHDPAAKATTVDPVIAQTNYIQNIPIVMDFGNNVNENAENMGIMSLFNNFTSSAPPSQTTLHVPEKVQVATNSNINTTKGHDMREGRTLTANQDMVSWNDIFSMIRKGHTNGTDQVDTNNNDMSASATYKKITLEEDVDGDGLIVLEDLQHLRDFDSNIASSSDEKLEVNSYERDGPTRKPGILNIPGNTKSVTVATASIVGLSMVLFLLTYAAFKWMQQRKKEKKRNFQSERIPTPVFENRKGHKNNSSTRSISPMLASSNIYTLNTLESQHHGKDSPEYMWDTLRKPFQ